VAVPVAVSFPRDPKEPSLGAFIGLEVVVLPFVVVVVVYCNGPQVTLVFVAPVTAAVRLVDCPRMRSVPAEEVMLTTIALAVLLLPQPPGRNSPSAASPMPTIFKVALNFSPTISPTPQRPTNLFNWSLALFLLSKNSSSSENSTPWHAAAA
jgi:hypothetical protein